MEELVRGTSSRPEQSAVLWCLHLSPQGQSLGLPPPGAVREGVHRCAELSRNSCTHHRKIGAFCDLNCLTWKKSHLESNQVEYFSFRF